MHLRKALFLPPKVLLTRVRHVIVVQFLSEHQLLLVVGIIARWSLSIRIGTHFDWSLELPGMSYGSNGYRVHISGTVLIAARC